MRPAIAFLFLLYILMPGSLLGADEDDHCPGKRYLMNDSVRAGCAHNVGWWAVPGTNCRNYAAGYVGGGAVIDGDGPDQFADGTWGLDYVGIVVPKKVFLNWWHGRKFQGGSGAYETDGPHLKHHK